jgi:hypothetical protein
MRTILQWAVAALACAVTIACCPDTRVVVVQLSRTPRAPAMFVGDTSTLYATVTTACPPFVSPREHYNSVTAPDRISFRSSDTSIVQVTATGALRARRVGETRVFAIAEGNTSDGEFVRVVASSALGTGVSPQQSVRQQALETWSQRLTRRACDGASASS